MRILKRSRVFDHFLEEVTIAKSSFFDVMIRVQKWLLSNDHGHRIGGHLEGVIKIFLIGRPKDPEHSTSGGNALDASLRSA